MGENWAQRGREIVSGSAAREDPEPFQLANAEMVRRSMEGCGPDSLRPVREAGMRVVYNMSSAHVPALIRDSSAVPHKKPYLNGYDRAQAVGDPPPQKVGRLRQRIDAVVAEVGSAAEKLAKEDIYYGAVELNGPGMRYFGDFCLVLSRSGETGSELLLLCNSYDLNRSPVRTATWRSGEPEETHRRRVEHLKRWAGSWPEDAPDMAVVKVMGDAPPRRRRLTTGLIATGVLVDEDYLEVARRGTFGVEQVEEIRVSAADAGAEARIGDRTGAGPTPSLAEGQWRQRRRGAEQAAAGCGLKVRVVVTPGRDRG